MCQNWKYCVHAGNSKHLEEVKQIDLLNSLIQIRDLIINIRSVGGETRTSMCPNARADLG